MPENEIGSIRVGKANWNLIAPILFEEAVRRGEGKVASGGSLSFSRSLRPTTTATSGRHSTPPPGFCAPS